jgi:hypothetical protein
MVCFAREVKARRAGRPHIFKRRPSLAGVLEMHRMRGLFIEALGYVLANGAESSGDNEKKDDCANARR